MGKLIGTDNDEKILMIQSDIERLAQVITMQNQTIQAMQFALDYILKKIEVDEDDFKKYMEQKMQEYVEFLKEQMAKQNIVIPGK